MASEDNNNDVGDMKDITDPRESDVLCGRGGAALRHAGNQTYRRLVNLNKGLYITCLKTEKLKISRSIVAAIREQKGRFLERDAKKGVWFDIGDKKAIEKTSQALREGQPKLRKKMVEMGQIPAEEMSGGIDIDPVPVSVQRIPQYGNGIYNPRTQPNINGTMRSGMNINNIGRGSVESGNFSNLNMFGSMQQQQQQQQQQHQHQHQQQQMMGRNHTGQLRNSITQMPPPSFRALNKDTNVNNELEMLQQLSLTPTPQSIPSWTPSIYSTESSFMSTTSYADDPKMISNRTQSRPFNPNTSSGPITPINNHNNNNNNNNDLSDVVINGGHSNDRNNLMDPSFLRDKILSFDPSDHPQRQKQQQFSTAHDHGRNDLPASTINDRRHNFAKMKYERKNSPRYASSRSITDGMPDIHMVDSQFSLLSNLSAHGSKHHGQTAVDMAISTHGGGKTDSMGSEYIGVGSRRSLMSGFSKLNGHSDINNTFSNMSKKIGGGTNHSTRSLALSEFSGVDEDFAEDDFSYELPPT